MRRKEEEGKQGRLYRTAGPALRFVALRHRMTEVSLFQIIDSDDQKRVYSSLCRHQLS
jgi:hypothetical protein